LIDGDEPDEPFFDLSTFEKKKSRKPEDPQSDRHVHVCVGVKFSDFDAASILVCNCRHRRLQVPAGLSAMSPDIDQHRNC